MFEKKIEITLVTFKITEKIHRKRINKNNRMLMEESTEVNFANPS
jgi:hypothetical protein